MANADHFSERWLRRESLTIVGIFCLFLVIAIGVAVFTSQPPSPPVSSGWTERGMNITSYQAGDFASASTSAQLDQIKQTGTNTAVVIVTWYQATATDNAVYADGTKSATDSDLRSIISLAQSKGMSVVLKPHVDVLDGTFRGDITPTDPKAWMASYGNFVSQMADLAAQTGVRSLVVGTELKSMSGMTADWNGLIDNVRSRFHGMLTYAANWIDEAEKIQFWGKLDALGIDAYMPLVKDNPDPSVSEMVDGWQPWKKRIHTLQQKVDKPVLFTELGYVSRLGTAEKPFEEGTGTISQGAQSRAYEAAFQTWTDISWFQGIWWWDSISGVANIARDAGSYPPLGKQAEKVLTEWLG